MTSDEFPQLSPESLDEYFAAGVSTTHNLSEDPSCELILNPVTEQFELITPLEGALPEISGLQRVQVDTVALAEGTYARLTVDARDMHHEAYGLVVSVVQALRGGASFASATSAALTNLKAILASRRRLSHDQEIGLLGELLVIDRLIANHSEKQIMTWWLGPENEQHDFSFEAQDVEVKTTTSERRIHVVHGTGQLQPSPHRPLWLLSIQITRSGGGGGTDLSMLVQRISQRLDGQRQKFVLHLNDQGWREKDQDLYVDRYLLRSAPQAYPVDDDFPAITEHRLKSSVPHAELVSAITYRVDVSNRSHGLTGSPVDAFIQSPS